MPIPIKWYRSPPGAKFFPFPIRWGHLDWYSRPWEAAGVGEIYEAVQKWSNGETPAGVTGQHFHGTEAQFRDGCEFDANHFTSRNAQGVATICTGEPPIPPPIKLNLCTFGDQYLSRTLRLRLIPNPGLTFDCYLSPEVVFEIQYDELNQEWHGLYTAAATNEWSITLIEVRFDPIIPGGEFEVLDWAVSKIGEPDCLHVPPPRLYAPICFPGWVEINPFRVLLVPEGYMVFCIFLGCQFQFEITDPADG